MAQMISQINKMKLKKIKVNLSHSFPFFLVLFSTYYKILERTEIKGHMGLILVGIRHNKLTFLNEIILFFKSESF